MIATEHFVFIHLHTCGGDLVNDFFRRFVPESRHIGRHLPRRMAPPNLAHLPTLGFVRSPWSYYAVWHTLQAARREPSPLYRVVSEDGRLDFEHTLRNLLDLGQSGRYLDAVQGALPARFTGRGMNLPGFALESIRASQVGFFTFLYRHMYDTPGIRHVRRIEQLWGELPTMLVAVGQSVSAPMRAYAREAAAPRKIAYTERYSAALESLVAERDAEIIARHGYRFGD
ncbi:MAG: hypothetical protein ACREUT_21455 [Steroidobacteraceae bacterium]